jgi:hypothetical protein
MHGERIFIRIATLGLIFSAIAGCGGGGGGGDGPTDNNGGTGGGGSTPPPVTVTGTVGKGLVGNGVVAVYGVSSSGTVNTTALASARTNAQGQFTAQVSATTGPVVVAVTADAQTTMLDEIAGTSMPAPSALLMRAAVSGLNTTPVAVTPLTEMAFAIASAAPGGLTVANIDAANSAVSAAMLGGAPIVSTMPIDLAKFGTATVAQQAQAKLLTALAVAAKDGTATGPTGTACSDADYGARIACMVSGLKVLLTSGASGSVTFAPQAAYVAAAYEKLNNGLVTVQGGQTPAAIGLDVRTTAESATVDAVTAQAVLFGYDASASPLANTKALFADLRTNVIAVQAGDDIFGIAPTIADIDADYRANVAPVLGNTRSVLVAAFTAAALVDAAVAETYEWASGHVVCGYDPAGLQTAANVALCRYGDEWDEQILLTVTRSSAGTYAVNTQPLVAQPWGAVPGNYNPVLNPYYGESFVPSPALAASTATFTRTTNAGGAITTGWRGAYYVTTTGGRVTAELDASQSDDWNPTTITGTLRVGGSIREGSGGIELTEATIGSDSQVFVQNGALGEGPVPELYGSLSISRLATARYVYSVKATVGQPVRDKSLTLALPGEVSVTGQVARIEAGGTVAPVFNGRIGVALVGLPAFDATQPIDASNSFGAQAQVVGNLSLPNGRVLAVSVAASGSKLEATPEAPYSMSVTYAYTTPSGIARINATGLYDAIAGYRATVTTNSGVTVQLTRPIGGSTTGSVTANGVATATIADSTINYSDGTTESIF